MKLKLVHLTQLEGQPEDAEIVVLRPDDEEIAYWLRALRVPFGEAVMIQYDAEGPSKIRTDTRGTWRLPETEEERNRVGVEMFVLGSSSPGQPSASRWLGRFDP